MSIDYDRLRALAEYSTPGPWRTDEHPYMDGQSVYEAEGFEVAQHLSGFNAELVALAPDMARELLRLRRELTDLRDPMLAHEGYLRRVGQNVAANYVHKHERRLAQIIQGDTE